MVQVGLAVVGLGKVEWTVIDAPWLGMKNRVMPVTIQEQRDRACGTEYLMQCYHSFVLGSHIDLFLLM